MAHGGAALKRGNTARLQDNPTLLQSPWPRQPAESRQLCQAESLSQRACGLLGTRMMFRRSVSVGLCFCASGFLLATASPAGDAEENPKMLVAILRQQNTALQKAGRKQEGLIENLRQQLPARTQENIVPTKGEAVMNFTLGVKNLPES